MKTSPLEMPTVKSRTFETCSSSSSTTVERFEVEKLALPLTWTKSPIEKSIVPPWSVIVPLTPPLSPNQKPSWNVPSSMFSLFENAIVPRPSEKSVPVSTAFSVQRFWTFGPTIVSLPEAPSKLYVPTPTAWLKATRSSPVLPTTARFALKPASGALRTTVWPPVPSRIVRLPVGLAKMTVSAQPPSQLTCV